MMMLTNWLTRISRRRRVTIRVAAQNLPYGEQIYIAGNHPALGNWNPAAVAMERSTDNVWEKSFFVSNGTLLKFKFTRGTWESEAVSEGGELLQNTRLTATRNVLETYAVYSWRDQIEEQADVAETVAEPITGTVKYHHQKKGSGLQPRDIIVWLPPGYEEETAESYPVLYMHDGQNIVDPRTSFTGVDWNADRTSTELIEAGKICKIIIVGIYNTPDRLEEYSPSPVGDKYMQFVVTRVKPFIDSNYRTKPGREHTATLGSSMGGLVAFWLVWNYPEIFSAAGCMSPSFIYKRNKAIKLIKKLRRPRLPVRIYIDCGGIGGEKRLLRGCRQVLRMLRRHGLTRRTDFVFYYDPEGRHSEVHWAARLWRPLTFMFGND